MPGEGSGPRVRGNTAGLSSSENDGMEVGMVRILVLNHAWKFPSLAPAGPEVRNGSRAGGGIQRPEAPRNVK